MRILLTARYAFAVAQALPLRVANRQWRECNAQMLEYIDGRVLHDLSSVSAGVSEPCRGCVSQIVEMEIVEPCHATGSTNISIVRVAAVS